MGPWASGGVRFLALWGIVIFGSLGFSSRSVLAMDPGGELPPSVATFSIVAVDTLHNEWGVAVASRFLAVGSVVPWARAGVGAIATQAAANTTFGPHALALLERGDSANQVLRQLMETDPGIEGRQIGLIDARGRVAIHTGKRCEEWAGGIKGKGFAIQGNYLAGPEVTDQMAKAFLDTDGSLAERMLASLRAGQLAGGDQRGREAAAILVVKAGGGYRGGNDRLVDLRVDDNPKPIEELSRLYRIHAANYLPLVHTRLGDEALAAGRRGQAGREYARVIHLYRQAIARSPRNYRLKNALAWFYVRHRVNLDEAFRLIEAAQKLAPNSWEVIDTLAEIHFARGNLIKARDLADKALQMDPQNGYLKSQIQRFMAALVEEERK